MFVRFRNRNFSKHVVLKSVTTFSRGHSQIEFRYNVYGTTLERSNGFVLDLGLEITSGLSKLNWFNGFLSSLIPCSKFHICSMIIPDIYLMLLLLDSN
jgi:hypothetical protein